MDKKAIDLDQLDFDRAGGVVTVVAQHARTGAVLTVGHADREALEWSIATGEMHFYTRTRGVVHHGKASGHIMRVVELVPDCDGDTVLARVEPFGPQCHTGQTTCFGNPTLDAIRRLEGFVMRRANEPSPLGDDDQSITRKLLKDRTMRLKKLGEEASALTVALADGDKQRSAREAADLVFSVIVALHAAGIPFDEVRKLLEARTT